MRADSQKGLEMHMCSHLLESSCLQGHDLRGQRKVRMLHPRRASEVLFSVT